MNGAAKVVAVALVAISARANAQSPCWADPGFRKLAFWVGDWTVYDSTGKEYATQKVRDELDQCAVTIDWTSGGGNKGYGVAAYDARAKSWRQLYASNQLPTPSGVFLRTSDPAYAGPGVRFIALTEPPAGVTRSRITVMPMDGHRVMELFESSKDDGKTWSVVFKAEHRPMGG